MRKLLLVAAVLVSVGIACSLGGDSVEVESPSSGIVEVTRIVTKEVEVTRLVQEEQSSELPSKSTSVPTPTIQRSRMDHQSSISQATVEDLEKLDDVERVNLVKFDEGVYEIEIQTVWASQDSQPEVSWLIVTLMARVFADASPGQRMTLTGSEELTLVLTSYSTNGDFRYKSETDIDTMIRVNNRSISYEDWILLANAGFR